ncbi:RagB/SusD family nutrient uptake outer membrane protein [Pedobacter soli]|uniref:Starch-binding associating with outer membrane n=1 Tax=Pedobacter soli TaxID=390242 RepID=A0A1G6UCW9_9SPHI|nr:RagB/SusD family nutrient uptake outer membrane protein [Pedobacter soli]SDD39163.1 Starch-binding associating with outer membrane [Pedobacter soli]
MKNIKAIIQNKKLYLLVLVTFFAAACKKDFMDVNPPDKISADLVWKDPALAQAFVNDIYNGLGNGGFSEQMLASVSDEAMFTHPTRGIDLVNNATINPSTLGWVDDTWAYKQMYNRIRACNTTIERIVGGDNGLSSQGLKDQLLGEAYFLRAYFYQQLLRYYGAVALITKTYTLTDNFNIKRNTYEECVNFIIKDCDEANRLLAGKTLDKGRTSALAALALKSRVLIYAASDLHDRAKLTAKITGIAAQKLDFLSYASGNQADRYRLAQTAAKAVLDAGTGYKLTLSAPATTAEGQVNFKSIAMGGGSKAPGIDATAASELIFARYFITQSNNRHAQQNGPNGYHNWAGNTPIGLLVDDYEMNDGSKFSWTNPVQKANPYQNRDPRFYATILYDGAGWKPRDKASGNVDPANQIQTGIYDLLSSGSVTDFKGLDTRGSSIENWNGSWTGYYYHKFIDPDPNIVDASAPQTIPWPFFRYTEAVFNYIEASIELGELTNATNWLNKIRFRAGMPAVTATDQAGLREVYRHERRIEMAYEEQRYHDTRRWLIASETLGRKVTYIKVTGKFKAGKTMSAPYHYDPTVYDYTYTPVIENAQENRSWDNKLYFRPFSRDEINKNNLLEQNPGY